MGKKLNLYQFIENSKLIHNDKYDYSNITEYVNNKSYYAIRCVEHDLIFKIRGDSHLQGQGCRECKRKKLSNLRKNSLEDTISLFVKKHGDRYDYSNIVEYSGCDKQVSIICRKHGVFNQSSRNHWNGQGCIKCYNETRHTLFSSSIEEFINKSRLVHGDKYDYSKSIYKNNKTKLEILCKIHGSFFKKPNNHINASEGCPNCNSSQGEMRILSILMANNIDFTKQKTYEDCLYKNKLRFDFYLPKYNMCIEYNGTQHYKPVNFFGGYKQYEEIKIRDDIKKKYCNDNNIRLLIIKSDENILDKLKMTLNIDMIDVEYKHSQYLSYNEAIYLINKLNIKSQKEYRIKYKEISAQLPSHPDDIYKYNWVGWTSFLSKTYKQKLERDSKGRFIKDL